MNLKFKFKRFFAAVKLVCFGLFFFPLLLLISLKDRIRAMRNLVIGRISEILIEMPDVQMELAISIEDLNSMSNVQLLDLYEEIFLDILAEE